MALIPHPRHFVAIVDIVLGCLRACEPIHLVLAGLLAAGLATVQLMKRRRTVYLVDYACFQGIGSCRMPRATFIEHIHLNPLFDEHSVSFMTRMLESSAIGEETRLPAGDLYMPAQNSFQEARAEAELVVFSAIDDLFAKTVVTADAIDILVVNCSVFAPVPSISDMIVNRYKLRDDVRAVNLSGMGCSAGVISAGLAAGLLQATGHGATQHALVVSTEIITCNFYTGKERPMQLSNVLFRVGGAAVLLSTSEDRARFRLSHLVRTSTTGTHDGSYSCVFQEEDGEGNLGVNLSKDLLAVAGNALKANIRAVAPLVLPLSEQLLFAMSFVARKLGLTVKPHVPGFRKAFDHFCVHCGGRAVIDKVQSSLGLSDEQVEASRMTLHRFGNTSSSTVWYELAYIEAKGRMRKNDTVWMIAFGSGFKCNSAIWECIRPADQPDRAWAGCIHRYPATNYHSSI
ncbi:3-ketoacyl-CoA synthase 5-like [Aegilops tauschii subsp. strangulata]|nr:3-ketoacyl-CoA synthase 5-like [Aegilops tauschii subsp. strangulata]